MAKINAIRHAAVGFTTGVLGGIALNKGMQGFTPENLMTLGQMGAGAFAAHALGNNAVEMYRANQAKKNGNLGRQWNKK